MTAGNGDAAQPPARSDGLRASDDERLRVAELLGEHAAAGRLTLGELEERVGHAYAATTRGDLVGLTSDLPEPEVAAPRQGKFSRWFVAILGGSTRRGRIRLSGRVNVVAVMGGDDIDLRDAEIDGSELVVNVFSLMGGPDIYLPDTVDVEMTGVALLGGNDERGSHRQSRPGAPVVRIKSFAVMGGADVWRVPAETRGLSRKQAKRAAKELERGAD